MIKAVFGTGLRSALAFGAPPAAVTGYAPASAKNNIIASQRVRVSKLAAKTLD